MAADELGELRANRDLVAARIDVVAVHGLSGIWGIRVAPEIEVQGLDVHEHGMWGYPEFYIPVPPMAAPPV